MTESGSIRVFISYSHDSQDHKDRVLELADRLCGDGLDCQLDQYEAAPPEGWPRWMTNQIEDADFVLVVCTENYNARFRGKAPKGTGLGGKWEGAVITQELYDAEANNVKFVPVLISRGDTAHIPIILKGTTYYDCGNDEGYEGLYRRITGQHFIPKPEIGGIRKLPTKERRTTRPAMAGDEGEPGGISAERFEELTTYARQRIAEAATQWLSEECDPFIMPALSRRVQRAEAMASRHGVDPWEPLSDEDSVALVLGQLPNARNRVRIFSDSGMGKTTLLHHCEQQIAQSDEGHLPVRVWSLSHFDWRGDVPRILANRVLHAFLPTDTDEATRVAWLRQVIHENKVVFLFDAVDQTDDQLAGFAQFMQSADVCHCPVIVTGRPEVEQTRARVFYEANWDTLRVEPFNEERIRDYLGELSGKLLEWKEKPWRDTNSERKQHWKHLLHIPLLLRLMRRLASAEHEAASDTSLSRLRNRHAIYHEAMRHLVDQGWASLSETPQREDLVHDAEVNERLCEMAWAMVWQGNFTGVFEGTPFNRWLIKWRHAFRALEQIDLTTRHSVLDNPREFGIEWRHLSFCEYFAGLNLASQDRQAQEAVAREHGRDPQWQWVFRFALSDLQAAGKPDACAALARDLIRYGNPFLVYDAVRGDRLKIPVKLDTLCRWLVHRDGGGTFDSTEAWESDADIPEVDDAVLGILSSLFDRSYRDSRCLHPAWELLTSSSNPLASEIRSRFQAEYQELATGTGPSLAAACSLSTDEHFIKCPPDNEKRRTSKIGEKADRSVKVKPFYLGKAPITNQQYELFDPSLKQLRDQFSPDDDSPVNNVNWYMAVMFCTWLGSGFRLPTEVEWEVACRAGTTTAYWWGDKFDATKCNSEESGLKRAMPANPTHANAWGFMDMLGNVWEWCEDELAEREGVRIFRGGAYYLDSDYCSSSSRGGYNPNDRNLGNGLRVAGTYP